MKRWLETNTVPILWEILYIISTIHFPQYSLYINTVFFIGIIIWFHNDFSFKALNEQWRSGIFFWKATICTIIGLIVGFVGSALVSVYVFNGVEDGMFKMPVHGWGDLLLFACNTIFLPPLAQELFHRKNLINDSSKSILILTSIISVLLYSVEHGIGWAGIVETVCLAIPFTISYVKTKNVYIVITAHFILNLIGNLPDVIMGVNNMMKL